MKKLIKILLAVVIVACVAFAIYAAVKRPFRKINCSELSAMLSEALDIDSEDPFALLCDMGMVDESISKDPDNYLKNEEAYSIISRAYLFNENDATSLNYISDSAKISSQFKYDLAGLVGEKYIDKGKIRPASYARYNNIRKLILDIRGTDITAQGSCYDNITDGNFSIKSQGVTLTHAIFGNSIIVCDTDNATLELSGVILRGKLIVRAANGTKIVIKDETQIERGLYIVNAGGSCVVETDNTVSVKVICGGEAEIYGNVSELSMLEGSSAAINGGAATVKVKGQSLVDYQSGSFSLIYTQADEAEIRVNEGVTGTQLASSNEASKTKLTVGGTVEEISVETPESIVNLKSTAKVGTLNVYTGSDGTTVLIEKRAQINAVNKDDGVDASIIDNRSQYDGRR